MIDQAFPKTVKGGILLKNYPLRGRRPGENSLAFLRDKARKGKVSLFLMHPPVERGSLTEDLVHGLMDRPLQLLSVHLLAHDTNA